VIPKYESFQYPQTILDEIFFGQWNKAVDENDKKWGRSHLREMCQELNFRKEN